MNTYHRITSLLEQNRDEERAEQMSKYMRYLFPFYGVNKPVRARLFSQLKKDGELPGFTEIRETVENLYSDKHRECHYMALDLLVHYRKFLAPDDLPWIESLIVRNSWWDSVDILAPTIAGNVFRKFPESLEPTVLNWNTNSNIWLIRASILAQLKFRTLTNVDLQFRLIEAHTDNKEFFIAKAIGWALREYAKTDPETVKQFVEKTTMQNLSKREALKGMK